MSTPLQSPKPKKSLTKVTIELPYEVVTSFNLKRMKPKADDKLVSFLLPQNDFKDLQLLGIHYGVHFGEVLKGLINQLQADVNSGSTLTHFIPVLNC